MRFLVRLLINALALWATTFVVGGVRVDSGQIGFGLVVDGFWWGVLGALVLAVVAWLIGIVIRPIVEPSDRRR